MGKVYSVEVSFSTRISAASPEDAEIKIRDHLAKHPERLRVKVKEVTDYDDLVEEKEGP